MQLWFSQSHPIHAEEPSIWDSGSKSIFDEKAWMKTSRHLSAVYYHRHRRIPPLSHVIYSRALYILSNLLSSPSRWWKETTITSLRDSIIQEHKQWFAKIPIMQCKHLHAICTLMSLNAPSLFLKVTFNDMSQRQINAQASESISKAIACDFTALSICLITLLHSQKCREEATCVQKVWGLSGTEMHGTAVWLGLGWSEVRELMSDVAIQRCWPNYVIKGA